MEAKQTLSSSQPRNDGEQPGLPPLVPETAGSATIVLSSDGLVQSWNPGMSIISGYEAPEAIGNHFEEFFREEDRRAQLPQRLLNDALARGCAEHEGWAQRKDRILFRTRILVSVMHDRSQEVTGFAVAIYYLSSDPKNARMSASPPLSNPEVQRRITQLEQQCHYLESELASRTQEMNTFSYAVTHDLQAPLRAITGYSNILQEEYHQQLDEEGKDIIEVITRNVDRANLLMQKALDFSRLYRRKISGQPINMKTVFEKVYQRLLSTESASRTISYELGDLPAGYGDPALIEEVVFQLLSNALKFTQPRSSATVRVRAQQTDEEIIYTVEDNGVGFDERYKVKLFDIFQRLHKKEFEGHGVGLAIVQLIVQKHGGRVWGGGKPNEGAAFSFTLPRENK